MFPFLKPLPCETQEQEVLGQKTILKETSRGRSVRIGLACFNLLDAKCREGDFALYCFLQPKISKTLLFKRNLKKPGFKVGRKHSCLEEANLCYSQFKQPSE